MLKPGLYEQVIYQALRTRMEENDEFSPREESIGHEEAAKTLAHFLVPILERHLEQVTGKDKNDRLSKQIIVINKLIETLGLHHQGMSVDQQAKLLVALLHKQNTIQSIDEKIEVIRPMTSIAQSSLFTGARHEPALFTELKKEILSCNRIDMLVSFIKWSGLRLIMEELKSFTSNGGRIRVITTSYMGATDLKAIEEFNQLSNTEIKISYDTKHTRLHAKAYVFYRDTGYTTAYVGSSNLSNAAISDGLEWNMKVTNTDLSETISKIQATFENYWHSDEFIYYQPEDKTRLDKALRSERKGNSDGEQVFAFDIKPYPYQEEILDKLQAERTIRGYTRNLLVSATGTGKTVISAFDYRRFCNQNRGKPNRLLFIAHREEILKQSISCFRSILRDVNFGELFVGSYRPQSIDYLFMSIQTFHAQQFHEKTTADFYDFILIDEFHHASAPTYQKVLAYYQPKILLGLTATPERMDGHDITKYFGHRIAAEIRLPEAIDRKLLCPFHYFGVADEVDLQDLKWSRGGYDKSELSQVYTGNDFRVHLIVKALRKYVTELIELKGLGFCVSKDHAMYMSMMFNQFDIPSIHLTSDSGDEERNNAKSRLLKGDIRFIFVVDIYNEGVDIPEVNTILFLRPTESLTVFLQQLGRGLRHAQDKECLTVLDFVGQANKRYQFQDKFRALLALTSKSVYSEIEKGFPSLPKGCYIQLEKKAKSYILENIRSAYGNKKSIINLIANFQNDTGMPLSLTHFIEHHHLEIGSIYKNGGVSFARLCVMAGVREPFEEELEKPLSDALIRICAINSRRWITYLLEVLPQLDKTNPSDEQMRMLNMLQFTIFRAPAGDVVASLARLQKNPILLKEICEVLTYQYNQIDFVDQSTDLGFSCPLDLHCAYTRDQILVALDFFKPDSVREGVKYLPDKMIDILFVTLFKSEREYSPTTMYNDYSINEKLFHWQSQNATSSDSPTGQRYAKHKSLGSKVLLFIREYKETSLGTTAPYTCLGLCDFVKSEGSKPMNIIWRLHVDIPAKYLKTTNTLVVG